MALLALEGVGKSYGAGRTRTEVLQGIDLRVNEGEFVAIVGYSGAGKTTLLSLIAGLLHPDVGKITLGGKPLAGPGPDRGVVFQNYSLLPWLTAYENVHLAVDQVFTSASAAEKRARTERYLDLVKLSNAGGKKPHELSGGMRQRVSVARALATEPRILLLDEPLGALDALTRGTLQDEIASLFEKEKRTVFLVTNDIDEAVLLADRIIPLSAGPRATLGPAIPVDLPRPRARRTIARDPRAKATKADVIRYLLGPGRRRRPGEPQAGAPTAPRATAEVAA